MDRVRQSLGAQGINLPITVTSDYANPAPSAPTDNQNTPAAAARISNATISGNSQEFMNMMSQNLGNLAGGADGNSILQAVSGIVSNLGPVISQVTQQAQAHTLNPSQPVAQPTVQPSPQSAQANQITRQMDSMMSQMGDSANTTQIGQTMQAMRNAIVSGGTGQTLSDLMNSARTATEEAGGEADSTEKLFVTDVMEILMTKLTMQDMIGMGNADADRVKSIAVVKIAESRNEIRKYLKDQHLNLELPSSKVSRILSEKRYGGLGETECNDFDDERVILDVALDSMVSEFEAVITKDKKDFDSRTGINAFKSNMKLYRDFVSMCIRNLADPDISEKEFGEKVYEEGFLLLSACIRLNDYVLKDGRAGLTRLMSSVDDDVPSGFSNMFVPMIQQIVEKTSSVSSIDQEQWNRYIVKEKIGGNDGNTNESKSTSKSTPKSTQKTESNKSEPKTKKVESSTRKSPFGDDQWAEIEEYRNKSNNDDVDLMADSEDTDEEGDEEFFDTESNIKKSESSIKLTTKLEKLEKSSEKPRKEAKTTTKTKPEENAEWKTVLESNATSNDWISTMEADLKALQELRKEEQEENNSEKVTNQSATKRRKIEVNTFKLS